MIECIRTKEVDAVALARMFLQTDKYEAVRVIREREAPGEIVFETPIFQATREGRQKPPLSIANTDDEDCWCDTLDDLYGGRSRRAIGQLLRPFLDQMGITPGELLTQFRFVKKLETSGNLRLAAVHRIARARADSTGAPLPYCTQSLDTLIDMALNKARDAVSDRQIPRFGDDGLDSLVARCKAAADTVTDQMFLMRYAIGRALEPKTGLSDRLAQALEWAETAQEAQSHALMDEIVADCLGSAATIQEMLGRQPDLSSALQALIQIASDRYEGEPPMGPAWFGPLKKWLADRPCVETRTVMLARVRRELAGDRPLTRGDSADEGKALSALAAMMKNEAEGTYIGGTGVIQSLARRWSKLDLASGLGAIEVPKGSPKDRMKALLAQERKMFGDTRKRAMATLMLDVVRDLALTERSEVAAMLSDINASGVAAQAKAAITRELSGA